MTGLNKKLARQAVSLSKARKKAAEKLARNVEMELTLSHLLLDLAGKWY